MKLVHVVLAMFRLLLVVPLTYCIFFNRAEVGFSLVLLFILVEWVEYHWWGATTFSYYVSASSVLFLFFVLLYHEAIPILLAAIFMAAMVIKLIFFVEDHAKRRRKVLPSMVRQSVLGALLFLSCYFFPPDPLLTFLSGCFIAYMVVGTGAYTSLVRHAPRE